GTAALCRHTIQVAIASFGDRILQNSSIRARVLKNSQDLITRAIFVNAKHAAPVPRSALARGAVKLSVTPLDYLRDRKSTVVCRLPEGMKHGKPRTVSCKLEQRARSVRAMLVRRAIEP